MLEKFAHGLTRRPKLVVAIALILLIPSLIGILATKVNYDILSYLPKDLESTQGEELLEEPFEKAATNMLIVEGMPPKYTDDLLTQIKQIPHVSNAVWVGNEVGIQLPTDMLPDDVTSAFYSGDATLMLITYDQPGASDETMEAIDQVRSVCNENCFLAGFSVIIKDTKELSDKEIPLYVLLAVVLSLAAMSVMMDSWVLPFAILGCIGLAILYNMGTNLFLGQISYVTKAIAAVLQLGTTTDYSIFLYSRYEEEKHNYPDKRDAMAQSIQAAFVSLSGSSMTTVAGFAALCAMRLLLGRDIGIVMAKGVLLGVATVILVLPAVLLVLDKYIDKYQHRRLNPNLHAVNNFVIKHSKAFVVLFLISFLPAAYSQTHAEVYYNLDRSLPDTMPSIVATNKLRDEFNMDTTHFVILHNDAVTSFEVKDMTDQIKAVDGVESAISYSSLVSPTLPDFMVPSQIHDLFISDGMQILMISSSYRVATDEVSNQLKEIDAIVKSYDPDAYITGEAPMTRDLIDVANVDFKVTNYISLAAIFLIVMLVFKSVTVPLILVGNIELAILINEGISYYTGAVIPFIAPTIIGCVQLGATVDYAILMTSRFREELQNGHTRDEAIHIAATTSDTSILTSSLVLFCATFGVSCIAKIEIISSICVMLARGALISAATSMFILPSLLKVCEPVINKTSLDWRVSKKQKKALALAAQIPSEQETETVPLVGAGVSGHSEQDGKGVSTDENNDLQA